LVLLTLQNSLLALVIHRSRMPSGGGGGLYLTGTAVLLSEVGKAIFSSLFGIRSFRLDSAGAGYDASCHPSYTLPTSFDFRRKSRSLSYAIKRFSAKVFTKRSIELLLPAILYVAQNNLQLVAASLLEPATFQVLSQLKIFTTAVFLVLILGRKLDSRQWFSIFFLIFGVAMVQLNAKRSEIPPHAAAVEDPYLDLTSDARTELRLATPGQMSSSTLGFLAILVASVISGFAGVYIEKVVKTGTDLWVANTQLSLFSIAPALVPLIHDAVFHADPGRTWNPMRNFGFWAWATVAIQVAGGLLVALVMKYADNVLKGFATSLAIVLSFTFSVLFLGSEMEFLFILGSSIIILSTLIYSSSS
ncbi:nucleotide-sugar transporter, partial [Violaceomyces palustris]